MTRKDYIEIAATVADMLELCTDDGRGDIRAEGIADTARSLCAAFQRDNPRFDRQRFYFAAGMNHAGRPLGGSNTAYAGIVRPSTAREI
jgi:hypothetical protein